MSELPSDASDPIARFLLASDHFSSVARRVKPSAFLPDPYVKLSVFLVAGLSHPDVWEIGLRHVAGPQGKALYGHAELTIAVPTSLDLRVEVDNMPPRHANIVGWPEGPGGKPKRKLLAARLAERAVLRLRDPSGSSATTQPHHNP
jgi:hypothetical protein